MNAGPAQEVVRAWEELEAAIGLLGVRRENQLVDEADRLVGQAMAESASRAELLAVLDTARNERLKDWLRGRLLPDTDNALEDQDAFRAHPLVNFSTVELPVRPSLALLEVKENVKERRLFKDPEEPGRLSWLAGSPASSSAAGWPADHSGVPLAHVAQVDLGGAADSLGGPTNVLDDLGLPKTGVLQLFHDLQTYGWEAEERQLHGWHVRWVQQPDRLLKRPRKLDDRSFRKPQRLEPIPALSIPPADAFQAPQAVWKRYERLTMHIEDRLRSPFILGEPVDDHRPTAWESNHHQEAPTSRMGGFGHHPLNEDPAPLLGEMLPLAASDDYFLLFDIAGVRHLEDWFGDSGHLQTWIRRSDLLNRQFDDVWCVIRAD